jgi:hypothetical protein
MTYTARIETINRGATHRMLILRTDGPLTHGEVMDAWRDDDAFRTFFNALVADAPFEALFWETPAVTQPSMGETFECIVSDAPGLAAMPPDPGPFARQFEAAGADSPVATFRNLSGDAVLVAPVPRAPIPVYVHLAHFCRYAPEAQRHAFWRAVGNALSGQMSNRPVWLSTSGLGVGWLHARIDTLPKYYTFQPYRRHPVERP